MAVVSVAVLSIGATEPLFPEISRADQTADLSHCAVEQVDGLSVCTDDAMINADLSIVTVATGITVVN